MSEPEGPPTVFTSSSVDHPVDRTALTALEAEVGEEGAMASCTLRRGSLAVINDTAANGGEGAMVVLRSAGDGWSEEGRFEFWSDAYRALGPLLDAVVEDVPVDPIDRPSPTLVIPCGGGIEVMFATAEGVRIARELDEGFDPRFEVYDLLWPDFTTATEDEASAGEMRG